MKVKENLYFEYSNRDYSLSLGRERMRLPALRLVFLSSRRFLDANVGRVAIRGLGT